MTTQRAWTVWVISDGVAGHYRQSEGVVLALQQLANAQTTKVETHWLTIHLKNGLYRQLLKWQMNRGHYPLRLVQQAYRDLVLPTQQPDIVIGAGGKSMYAVATLARHYRAKALFIGSLRGLDPEVFDAVLTIEPTMPPPYVSLPVAPMPITAETLAAAKGVWQQQYPDLMGDHTRPVWAMLIGGDGAGVRYTDDDWQRLGRAMNALAATQGIEWLVTTSRRTPVTAESILQQTLDPKVIRQAVYWHQSPQKVMQAYLAMADHIIVTGESMTMVTEAIYAQTMNGKPNTVTACVPISLATLALHDQSHARHIQALVDKHLLKVTDMSLTVLAVNAHTTPAPSVEVGLASLIPVLKKLIQ